MHSRTVLPCTARPAETEPEPRAARGRAEAEDPRSRLDLTGRVPFYSRLATRLVLYCTKAHGRPHNAAVPCRARRERDHRSGASTRRACALKRRGRGWGSASVLRASVELRPDQPTGARTRRPSTLYSLVVCCTEAGRVTCGADAGSWKGIPRTGGAWVLPSLLQLSSSFFAGPVRSSADAGRSRIGFPTLCAILVRRHWCHVAVETDPIPLDTHAAEALLIPVGLGRPGTGTGQGFSTAPRDPPISRLTFPCPFLVSSVISRRIPSPAINQVLY